MKIVQKTANPQTWPTELLTECQSLPIKYSNTESKHTSLIIPKSVISVSVRSATTLLLGRWVWNPLRAWMFVPLVSCVGRSGHCDELHHSFRGVLLGVWLGVIYKPIQRGGLVPRRAIVPPKKILHSAIKHRYFYPLSILLALILMFITVQNPVITKYTITYNTKKICIFAHRACLCVPCGYRKQITIISFSSLDFPSFHSFFKL